MYYAYRVTVLSRSRILGFSICAIALLQGSSAIAQGVQAFIIGSIANLATTKAFASCAIWLAATAACDVIIAGCMTFFLLKHDNKAPEMHALITKLVRLVVETGMLTALAATVDLILFLAFPHKAYHGCVALTLAKLYSNALLVLFNSRIRIVGARSYIPSEVPPDTWDSLFAKSTPSATSTLDVLKFHSSTGPASSVGGVHVHEERWIDMGPDTEATRTDDQSISAKTLAGLALEV